MRVFTFRINEQDHQMVEVAAALKGKTPGRFVCEAAVAVARVRIQEAEQAPSEKTYRASPTDSTSNTSGRCS